MRLVVTLFTPATDCFSSVCFKTGTYFKQLATKKANADCHYYCQGKKVQFTNVDILSVMYDDIHDVFIFYMAFDESVSEVFIEIYKQD